VIQSRRTRYLHERATGSMSILHVLLAKGSTNLWELRRHHDKHTRPYRCLHPNCKDLAGFGWVGGLNRHIEELHQNKSQHKCPYTDCKRNSNGFSRPANLKNHMRKVHQVEDPDVPLGNSPPRHNMGGSSDRGDESDNAITHADGYTRNSRYMHRTQEALARELEEAEQEVRFTYEESAAALKRKEDAEQRLQRLRSEYRTDGRFSSPEGMTEISYSPSHNSPVYSSPAHQFDAYGGHGGFAGTQSSFGLTPPTPLIESYNQGRHQETWDSPTLPSMSVSSPWLQRY
jgi:hypothetical protein